MNTQSLTFKTLLLAFGKALAALYALGITVLLTRNLSISEYASHKQALLVYAICAPALTLGLPKALYFFLPGDEENGRTHVLNNLFLLLGVGLAFALATVLFGGPLAARYFNNGSLEALVPLVGLYGMAMLTMSGVSACLVATNKVSVLVRYQIFTQLLLLSVVGGLAWYSGTAKATVSGYLIWSGCVVVVAILLMFKMTQGGDAASPSWGGMKAQLSYGIPLGLAGMFGAISTQVDKLMVSVLCPKEEFAVYVTGAIELPLIGMVTGAMSVVVLPELTKFHKAGRHDRIVELWQRAMNKAILVLAPAMFVVLLFGPEIMRILFSSQYEDASEPFRIYALSLPLRSAVFGSVLMATDKARWVTVAAVIGLTTNVILNLIFVQWFGAAGAAWGSVLTTYVVIAFMLYPMSKTLDCPVSRLIAWSHIGRVMLCASLPAIALFMLLPMVPAGDLVRLGIGGGLYAATVLILYQAFKVGSAREIVAFLRKR